MIALDPRYRVGTLHAALVKPVVGSEIVAKLEVIENAEVRLTGHAGEVVVTPGVLKEGAVYQAGCQGRIESGKQGLIADEKISSAAGNPNAAAIERLANKFARVARVLYVIADCQAIVGVNLVINSGKAVVIVRGLQERIEESERLRLRDVGGVTREIGKAGSEAGAAAFGGKSH